MEAEAQRTSTTVTVFVRHAPTCSHKNDRYYRGKGCNCRKALYIYEGGRDRTVSAKTRSWEAAEKLAKTERDRRDPANLLLKKIADDEAQRVALLRSKDITVQDATDRWLRSQRWKNKETETIYRCAARRIADWAEDIGVKGLGDITADKLDEWRGLWSEKAEKKYNRIGLTSQAHFLGYLKRFFRYAAEVGFLVRNPSLPLRPIAKSKKRTEVLTQQQFQEVLAAVPLYTAAVRGMASEFKAELTALFLLQRWSGMRINDCLMLPRTGLVGNNVQTITQKTGARVDCEIPDEAVAALLALSSERERFLPGYFFWQKAYTEDELSTKWGYWIKRLNAYLNLKDIKGQPMKFHSHMLRDTFAVELLLAGVALEDVSRMLTHASIKTTEDYYAHWVPDRLTLLKKKARDAMRKMGAKIEGQ